MNYSEKWQAELETLEEILLETGLEKSIKWGMSVFTWNGRNVVGCIGLKNYFGLWFYNGVFLTDPAGVLISAQEGKTKSMRQWRFESMAGIDEKKIRAYVAEAIEVEKKGLKIEPQKTELQIPAILQAELVADPNLAAAFETFTAGRQKEYANYIGEAKQEKTQQSRLDKVRPMILAGIGLNDAYRKS